MEGESLDWLNGLESHDLKGIAQDLLHQGNVDAVLLLDEQKGRDSYNDKLLKYNSKYAQLIGKQKSNVDEIANIVTSLPHIGLVDTIRRDIHELDLKQVSFKEHFDDFQRLTQMVTKDFLAMRQSVIGEFNDANFLHEESALILKIDQQENQLQGIRRAVNEDDKVSQSIKSSHLLQKNSASGETS